jgi:hypothetical protein
MCRWVADAPVLNDRVHRLGQNITGSRNEHTPYAERTKSRRLLSELGNANRDSLNRFKSFRDLPERRDMS